MFRAKLLVYDVITIAYVLLVVMALAPWALQRRRSQEPFDSGS